MTLPDPPQHASHPARSRAILLALVALVLLGLALRVGAIVATRAWEEPASMEHDEVAKALLIDGSFAFGYAGHYGPSSVQSPPYPLLLALLFSIFGIDAPAAYTTAMLLNALLGALNVWLGYVLVRSLRGPPWAGLLAAALLCVWPTQIYSVTVAQAIVPIITCTMAVVILFHRAVDTRALAPWLGFSLIGCLGALTEPVMLPFMALSGLLILFWRGLPWGIRLRNASILFLCATLILLPWTLRNYFVHGRIVPVKNTFSVNVWKTSNPFATGTDRLARNPALQEQLARLGALDLRDPRLDRLRQYDMLTPDQQLRLYGQTEDTQEAIYGAWAREFVAQNPGDFWRISLARFVKTFWYEDDNPKSQLPYIVSRTLLMITSTAGLICALMLRWRLFIPLVVTGIALVMHTFTIAAARFIFPHEPFQIALTAALVIVIANAIRKRPTLPTSH